MDQVPDKNECPANENKNGDHPQEPETKMKRSLSTFSSSLAINKDQMKISNFEAAVHIVKSTLGGGFLSMPDAFKNAGLLVGVIGTFILGVAIHNTQSTIIKCAQEVSVVGKDKKTNGQQNQELSAKLDFPETVEQVFLHGARGKFAKWASFVRRFTSIILFITYYGINVIYICILSSTTQQFARYYFPHGFLQGCSIRYYPSLVSIVVIPLGMIRSMKFLVPLSIAANIFMGIGSSMIFYYLLIADKSRNTVSGSVNSTLSSVQVDWISAPVSQWPLFIGTVLCAMEGVGTLLHIESAMENPKALLEKPWCTLLKSMVIIVIMNCMMGFFGYLRYGNQVQGSISLSLPENSWLSYSVKLAIALAVLLTYGLQLTVTTDLLWRQIKNKYFVSVDFSAEDGKHADKEQKTEKLTYYMIRLSLIISTILMATIVPNISPLVSLVGSIGFSTLGLTIPALMETVWLYCDNEDDSRPPPDSWSLNPRRLLRNFKNVLLLLLSVVAAIGGSYLSVIDIISTFYESNASV